MGVRSPRRWGFAWRVGGQKRRTMGDHGRRVFWGLGEQRIGVLGHQTRSVRSRGMDGPSACPVPVSRERVTRGPGLTPPVTRVSVVERRRGRVPTVSTMGSESGMCVSDETGCTESSSTLMRLPFVRCPSPRPDDDRGGMVSCLRCPVTYLGSRYPTFQEKGGSWRISHPARDC